ncbi:MAG TPA: universal stress protein [Rubrivivax sp.]|nr:universal stress protein [Rubrivivax sp.]HPO20906.1 universal stress protein [Rubrivivax sp.]
MYRHLLVPIDDSDLSIGVVGNAVGLARAVGARITFFHAVADPARSVAGDAELLRITAHDDYDYAYTGKARELLAKAEAAAHALGVPCSALQRPGDKPSTAIVEAARASGCDLIFMASHGRRGRLGMALASETLQVLMHAGLPVLVSSTGEPKPPAHAIGIIRDEHRSLAAVMHAWMHTLAEARRAGTAADAAQMQGIVRYLREFPLALHHPKEEQHLFRRLRERTDAFDAELDELGHQHHRDEAMVAELAALVDVLQRCGSAEAAATATRALDDAVQAYASFLWEHMGREESVILPAAQQYLSDADWVEIDRAFMENRKLTASGGLDKSYRQLFSRIVNTA